MTTRAGSSAPSASCVTPAKAIREADAIGRQVSSTGDDEMLNKIVAGLMAVLVAMTAVAANPEPAEAGHRGGRVAAGIAAGIIGLGILGAYANARDRHYYRSYEYARECYPGPERCGYTGRRCFYNDWGDYVCRRGQWRCWRETICD